jgi:chromosome segregation ATPase
MPEKTYKSPLKKLVKFFEKSRDSWKEKYFEKTKELKRAKNQINDLKYRKEDWKERAKKAEDALKEINSKSIEDKKKQTNSRD